MSYIIHSFNELVIPPYLRRGDVQNLGTGSALVNFLPLPGGGFYDNYRSRKSPQGIRPITKSFMLYGNNASNMTAGMDQLRKRLGERGKLTVRYDDGQLRWQWARLTDVSMPRPAEAKGHWLPVELTWVTAAQWWYGIIQGASWFWGDQSWFWGDGTAEFGGNVLSYSLTSAGQNITVTHNGNTPARNVHIELDWNSSHGGLRLYQREYGQTIQLPANGISSNSRLVIDCGSRQIYEINRAASIATTAIYRESNRIFVTSSGAHGLASGDSVAIESSTYYDGVYHDITVLGSVQFTIPVDPETLTGHVTLGTVRRVTRRYAASFIADHANWLSLAPGANTINFQFDTWGGGPLTTRFRFYDHYS